MIEDALREMVESRRQQARRLECFDAGIWLGPPVGYPLAVALTPQQLPRALERGFVRGGLVSHWRGKTVSAQDGNLALELARPYLPQDTYVVWTGLPLDPAEPGPLPGRGDLPDHVRGVRIFPKSHGYPLAGWTIGSLCDWLVEHRLPLLVWHVEIEWPSLRALAQEFPRLRIVVETQTQKILYHSRPLFALLRDCPNVLVEISNFVGAGFLEYAVRKFGAGRFVFGSFQPMNDPLVPIGMILDAEIAEAEKAMIAGGNLRALVNEVRL